MFILATLRGVSFLYKLINGLWPRGHRTLLGRLVSTRAQPQTARIQYPGGGLFRNRNEIEFVGLELKRLGVHDMLGCSIIELACDCLLLGQLNRVRRYIYSGDGGACCSQVT